MQMKKILGILLAVCFFMSVTVAAVSADQFSKTIDPKKDFKPIKKIEFKIVYKTVWKWVYIKSHIELKKVKKVVGYKHGKPVYKIVTIKVKVPGEWKKIPVKVPVKIPIRK